ncbi:ABC transporter ATP-binding protein [Cohnella nanjingensis]|uniref:ABC transporter ATP-binding protein n=1 Tax=Cohnella nanjingensis TaxID=1387779 RepID=A0A7X0RS89_9BACL|nr:ABC transporter ATP-binding protein [Cohnella nanjingensis]MBB6672722.1 ABC transporter ATP-binding protein [Cohnella nanjingensis]
MRYMTKYIRKYGFSFVIAFLLVSGEAVCDLLLPTLMAHMIDQGVSAGDMNVVLRYGGWMLLITGFGALSASGRNIVSSHVSQRFGAELRGDLFRKIQSLPFANVNRFDRASLVTRLTNDITQVQNFVNGMMRIFAKAPLLCIGGLIMAVRLNPHLSVVLAIVVPLVAALIALNMKVGFPLFMKVQRSLDRLNGIMREYLSGVRVVKAFNRFAYETDKFERVNEAYQRQSITTMRSMAPFSPAITLTVNLGIVAVVWLGGIRVNAGHMQVGHIIAFVNYMTQILFSLMTISMVFNMFVRAKASTGRIVEVFAEESAMTWDASAPTPGAEPTADPSEAPRPRIAFEGVGFSYDGPDGEPVLKDIAFACRPGETIGIIGSTGAGKSTLVGLIPRFYDATRGTVRIDGADVRRLNPEAIRERVAIVPQQTVLFSGTIADNIRWGSERATGREIEAAARAASAHGFVTALPEGYEAKLGQGGINLSGGQKQRLSIARALVRQPDILILDDCTSALDAVTEAAIKDALKSYEGRLTCLLIAQRISSVIDADQIVVMDDGEIAGIGTHASLLRECRVYQEIYRSQMGQEAMTNATGP